MGAFTNLLDWITGPLSPPQETFSETAPRPIDQVIYEMKGGGSAPRVGRVEALTVPAVQCGRNLLCSIATLPLVQKDNGNTVVRNPLLEQIDPDFANVVTLSMTVEDLVFEGVAWWRITSFGFDGYPASAIRLEPSSVTVNTTSSSAVSSDLMAGNDGTVWVNDEKVPWSQLIKFDSPNPAVLKYGGRSIRRAILLDQAARLYADDFKAQEYFTPADGMDPAEDDDIKEILEGWRDSRKKRSTAYVPANLKYNTVDVMSPVDLQLKDLQKQVTLEIANAFGVDPEDLGISTTSRSYQNAVDRRRDRVNDVLAPFMRAIADRLSMGDVTKRGYRVEFDLTDYMKANPTERVGYYQAMKAMGVMTAEEIRAAEGLSKMDELPEATVPIVEPANSANTESMTFDNDTELHFSDTWHSEFSVDAEKRTIEGLALPYGKLGFKGGLRYKFAKDSVQWNDVSRVKLLRDHDFSQAIGVATDIKNTPAGVKVKFRVARGEQGDRAIELAQDGVLDGLSVGVDFDFAGDVAEDPKNSSTLIINRADLREVSLTPMPAFDDARVAKVAASRNGETMKCATCGQEHAPNVACTPKPEDGKNTELVLNSDNEVAIAKRIAELLSNSSEGDGRQTVNPTRLTASTSVTEAAPYTFDRRGQLHKGTHEFSADLFAAQKFGDKAALDRCETFMREQFDVVTTDVNELNPTRNRPDMYVDQRSFRYPVWDAINKGTLPDITPFTFPKFSSTSGLVGAHTEGSEPSSGALVTTAATVTPTAISGKAKISREVWDQGGNPQISNLIWNQMVKGWFEALEAAAVAVLDAATPTAIALTAGGGTTGQTLDAELTAAFAALQFVRGGFSMDYMFTQIDLYKALVAAQDGDKRRLYPAIGPVNASGQVTPYFAALNINGVVALPSWALAATGSVVASSYLFDSQCVHGWATAPQRLTFDIEVANIYVGLWGYKAAVISDITGVREITYDPVP